MCFNPFNFKVATVNVAQVNFESSEYLSPSLQIPPAAPALCCLSLLFSQPQKLRLSIRGRRKTFRDRNKSLPGRRKGFRIREDFNVSLDFINGGNEMSVFLSEKFFDRIYPNVNTSWSIWHQIIIFGRRRGGGVWNPSIRINTRKQTSSNNRRRFYGS